MLKLCDIGNTTHTTKCPITKIPAYAFLYLLGHAAYTKYLGGRDGAIG